MAVELRVTSHMSLIFSFEHIRHFTLDQQNQYNMRAVQDGKVGCYAIKFRELAVRPRDDPQCLFLTRQILC